MLTFLLSEGILTVGAVSGIFTATLLGSLKTNIVDPLCENLIPTRILDKHARVFDNDNNKEKMTNILDANNYSSFGKSQDKIKWQTFLKDLVTWIVIMFILYLIWKYTLEKKIN